MTHLLTTSLRAPSVWLLPLALLAAPYGCSEEASATPVPAQPKAVFRPPAPPPPTSSLGTPELPGASATLRVRNAYPAAQFIFIDGATLLGVVDPGQVRAFRVPAGRHTFTSADSNNPGDHPVHHEMRIHRGDTHGWRIFLGTHR